MPDETGFVSSIQIVDGDASTHNNLFKIVENDGFVLTFIGYLDYTSETKLNFRVRVYDDKNGFSELPMQAMINTDIGPNFIYLTDQANIIIKNIQASGYVMGVINAYPIVDSLTYTYKLIDDDSQNDNEYFEINSILGGTVQLLVFIGDMKYNEHHDKYYYIAAIAACNQYMKCMHNNLQVDVEELEKHTPSELYYIHLTELIVMPLQLPF